jgi:Protein of unknown function (DUF4058)
MDPYIESSGLWGDFHGSLLAAIRSNLNAHLPDGFAASIELYVWAGDDEFERDSDGREPDVLIREEKGARGKSAVAMTAAPLTIVLPRPAPRKRKYLKVTDIRSRRIVTVVEVLSPANKKSGNDRAFYIEKRNEYLASKLNFVEIDLLRSGKRAPLGSQHSESIDFYALVCRSWEFPRAGFWTFRMRDPIPEIPIPVTKEAGDTLLDLRSCIDRVYDDGRYSICLPYEEPLKPRPVKKTQPGLHKF